MNGARKSSQSPRYRYSFLSARRAMVLPDRHYFFYLLDRIRNARYSIDCTIFIVDVHPSAGGKPTAEILRALAESCWLGVDVRAVVGHSRQSADIDVADRTALSYLQSLGVPARFANPTGRLKSLHSKYVIIDRREVIVGSHNWARLDLFDSWQTSLALYSPHLAKRLTRRFEELWRNSAEAAS